MEQIIGILGLGVMILLAWAISNDRKHFPVRTVVFGVLIQFLLALLVLKIPVTRQVFIYLVQLANKIATLSDMGAKFVFGDGFSDHYFAFKALPTIIFISALFSVLFYYGIIQKVIKVCAWVMQKTMKTSGVESLVAAANIFIGQTEAPLIVREYIKNMNRSEIMSMMVSGMSTIAGGVLVAFIGMGISAEHLLSASLISAPAALLIAKIILPQVQEANSTTQPVNYDIKSNDINIFDAACRGASDGAKMCIEIAAMLIAFIGLVALINFVLEGITSSFMSEPLSFEGILGFFFRPVAFIVGVPWSDCSYVGELLGEKMVINEFYAYQHMHDLIQQGVLSQRSIDIATYALCGFANFSSIAIQIGGIGKLEPGKKKDLASFGLKAMIGGTLASFMTACIASIIL